MTFGGFSFTRRRRSRSTRKTSKDIMEDNVNRVDDGQVQQE